MTRNLAGLAGAALIHIKAADDLSGTIYRSIFSGNMTSFVPRRVLGAFVLGLALLVSTGCKRADKAEAESSALHYEVRGVVRGIAPDHSTLEVEHEAIPGFMPAMTMPFIVQNPKDIAALRIGYAIAFRFSVTDRDSWIDQIKKISAAEVHVPAQAAPAPSIEASTRLRAGDAMPPFELADQAGRPLTLDTFRGRPFVLTFFFTRCPVPNFCPLMTRNFATLQTAIKAGAGPLAARELGAYQRSLTGALVHGEGRAGQLNVFASRDRLRQVVDEIPGQGISGPYQLRLSKLVLKAKRVSVVADKTPRVSFSFGGCL